MSLASSCVPCCDPTAENTQIPGPEGDAGQDGEDGANAFTTTTSPTTLPAIGANVTVAVADSSTFTYGQFVVMGDTVTGAGPATFQVVGIPTATSLTLKFMGYPSDEVASTIMPTGSTVSPAGEWGLPAPISTHASGTAYALTNTAAALDFGTTDPSITITAAGTYLLFARVRVDYTGATFAAVRTGTLKLRRTNNTAADITNGSVGFKTDIITTLTYTLGDFTILAIPYTTANSTDIITIFGDISVVPTAGTLDCVEANIVAVRIS